MSRDNIWDAEIRRCLLTSRNRLDPLVQTLAATYTMDADSQTLQFINAGGATRVVLLPPEEKGLWYILINTSPGAFDLTVKEDSNTTTITTVGQNEIGMFFSDGVVWRGFSGVL